MSEYPSGMASRTRTPRRRSRIISAAGGKFGVLLLALVALMASTPLIIAGPVWNSVLTVFTGAVLVASLHAARPGGRVVALGFALALADFGIGRCVVAFNVSWLVLVQILLWLCTLIYVTVTILEAIFDSHEVTVETLQASLCVYLLIGLIGAFGFALIDVVLPGSFQVSNGAGVVWSDANSRATGFMRFFVLSFATLSGASFTDAVPATGFARNAASLVAMTGQIYLAVVLARLVGIQSAPAVVDELKEMRANDAGPIEPE